MKSPRHAASRRGYEVLDTAFYLDRTDRVARRLLGCVLVRVLDGEIMAGRIVETEAYFPVNDPACHAHRGMTERNRMMFEQGGVAYVYFTYGNHYLLNAVTGRAGRPAAVLIRAIEPIEGLALMRANRPNRTDVELTSGPGKLAQALNITKELNGADLTDSPLMIARGPAAGEPDPRNADLRIGRSGRIGIREAQDRLARFYIADNAYVSVKPRGQRQPA
ncbi:MAG: DNA-3-methyladenine glycosylase [Verrucomicrobia bacterium]|nr:DNA-3-methyladenine glycosylase [Verrucomicrobiota bacterium]